MKRSRIETQPVTKEEKVIYDSSQYLSNKAIALMVNRPESYVANTIERVRRKLGVGYVGK